MSEEKKTHPEHKYSVTFVSKVGTKTVSLHCIGKKLLLFGLQQWLLKYINNRVNVDLIGGMNLIGVRPFRGFTKSIQKSCFRTARSGMVIQLSRLLSSLFATLSSGWTMSTKDINKIFTMRYRERV